MYSKIMVPVDLAHVEKLAKALDTAAALAKLWNAELVYVGVSAATPGSLARTPEEFADKLAAFATKHSDKYGVPGKAHAVTSSDPSTDLDPTLLKAAEDTGADLVVMGSHIPNLTDYIWPSNGGTIASRSKASVFVVRT